MKTAASPRRLASPSAFRAAGAVAIVLCLLLVPARTLAFQWDADTADGCRNDTATNCRTNATFHLACPQSCVDALHRKGVICTNDDPEGWYDLRLTKADGTVLSMEDTEGYVTMIAVLPSGGMVPYWTALLKHIQDVFPFTLETIVIPLSSTLIDDDVAADSKLIVLQPTDVSDPAIRALLAMKEMVGYQQVDLATDRVSVFLVSSDARYAERLVHPSRIELERRINVYLLQLKQQQKREL